MTCTATPISPVPSTLTGSPPRTAPGDELVDADRAALGEQRAEPVEVHHLVLDLNGFLKPRSFGSRMCSGICPPSNAARTW